MYVFIDFVSEIRRIIIFPYDLPHALKAFCQCQRSLIDLRVFEGVIRFYLVCNRDPITQRAAANGWRFLRRKETALLKHAHLGHLIAVRLVTQIV